MQIPDLWEVQDDSKCTDMAEDSIEANFAREFIKCITEIPPVRKS